MLVPGTQMHFVTFGFICLELAVLFYLLFHRLARPDDKISFLDVFLICLLIIYNVTGGLLPDPALPGSYFVQNCIAYATGFMTPCYFPYYVYKAFGLEKMKFHAYRGVFYFLIGPYLLFVTVFAISGKLETAKNVLGLPVVYAIWFIYSMIKAVRYKYRNSMSEIRSQAEITAMFLSLVPWVGLPVIDFFNLGQVVEVTITNTGFLILIGLHMKLIVEQIKSEHLQAITYNERLLQEVEKRTKELVGTGREERFKKNCEHYQLTRREKEIVRFIWNGNTHKQIAESLFISERTVAKHVQNVFEKVQVSNRVELLHKLGI